MKGFLYLAGLVSLVAAIDGCSSAPPQSAYAGQQGRTIKALSPKETTDLLDGAGMGFAKAAELNGYPGPAHVLELAAQLGLTPSQQSQVETILKEHKAEARRLGNEVLQLEQQLDNLFAKSEATPEQVDAITARLANVAGALRASHLKAHIATTKLLTASQVAQYAALRGYDGAHTGH